MATTVARLEAVLSAQTRDFDRAMDRSHSKTQRLGKAAGVAGLAILAGLGVTAKRGFDEISESQKVMAQTEAGIKSTGGVAKVTAKDISGLSDSLSRMSGIDDEVIQQGANLLLTFTKIHNEAGRGNDIFNRATAAALDLSVRGFGSLDAMSKQLGKALNDPIRGLTGLSRAGVQFSAEQRNMITAMVESGNVLGAQKVIMAEVETQVGGSAKAYGQTLPGQMAKARNAFDEISAKIMVAVLPAITAMLQKLASAVEWLDKNRTAAKAIFIGLGVLAGGMIALSIATSLAAIGFTLLWAAATAGLIVLIPALIAGFIVLWQKSELFRDIVHKLWQLFLNVTPIGLAIQHFGTLRDIAEKIWKVIGSIIERIKAMIAWIKKIDFPDIPDLNPFNNDSGNQNAPPRGGGGADARFTSKIWDEMGLAKGMGLSIGPNSSGRSYGDHGKRPSHAIDAYGSASQMSAFANMMYGRAGSKDIFYSPHGFAQDNGRRVHGWAGLGSERATHYDHVHYSVFDKGGWLKTGATLAINNTGRPERVGGGTQVFNFEIGGKPFVSLVWDELRQKAQVFERNNQRPAFGS